jgi:hypothetical protein
VPALVAERSGQGLTRRARVREREAVSGVCPMR